MSLKPVLALLLTVTTTGIIGAGGCQRPLTAMCRQQCACERCTDFDLAECEAKVEKAAEDSGKCGDEFQAFVDCLDDNLSCQNGFARTDKCSTEEKVLSACTHAGNPFKTVCETAAELTAECFGGSSSSGGQEQDCTGILKCQSQCILEVTCDELQQGSQKFNDCINQCGFGSGGGGFDEG